MNKSATACRIGIGGWEHEVLDHCFYPSAGLDSLEKLACYSGVFDTVEVRATFWDDTLTEAEARKWIQAVRENQRFTFNVKLHSSFTHRKSIKPNVTRIVRGLLHGLLSADRLGTMLMQFPYSFTNTHASRLHLVRLAEVFAGYPIHVEFRHDSWNHTQTWDLLQEHSLALASTDLPHVRQLMPYASAATGDRAYLRLHGRNEKGWLLNGLYTRYDYLYNDRELREIRRRLDALSQKSSDITVIFNNTTKGKAVANALCLMSALREGSQITVPAATLREFPYLQEVAEAANSDQMVLGIGRYRQAM